MFKLLTNNNKNKLDMNNIEYFARDKYIYI